MSGKISKNALEAIKRRMRKGKMETKKGVKHKLTKGQMLT